MDKEEYRQWREKALSSPAALELKEKFGLDMEEGIPKDAPPVDQAGTHMVVTIACPKCHLAVLPQLVYKFDHADKPGTVICPGCHEESSIMMWQTFIGIDWGLSGKDETRIRVLQDDPRTLEQKEADEEMRRIFETFGTLAPPELRKEVELKKKKAIIRILVGKVGKALGKRREAMGKTQTDLAEKMGTHASQISRIESGNYGGLTWQTFYRYWNALYEKEEKWSVVKALEVLKELRDEVE